MLRLCFRQVWLVMESGRRILHPPCQCSLPQKHLKHALRVRVGASRSPMYKTKFLTGSVVVAMWVEVLDDVAGPTGHAVSEEEHERPSGNPS